MSKIDVVTLSPFPEVPPETIDEIADRLPTSGPTNPSDLVVIVIHELLNRPTVLLALAGRFGEVKVQRGRRGVITVDNDGVPLRPDE